MSSVKVHFCFCGVYPTQLSFKFNTQSHAQHIICPYIGTEIINNSYSFAPTRGVTRWSNANERRSVISGNSTGNVLPTPPAPINVIRILLTSFVFSSHGS
eukprot:205831_1